MLAVVVVLVVVVFGGNEPLQQQIWSRSLININLLPSTTAPSADGQPTYQRSTLRLSPKLLQLPKPSLSMRNLRPVGIVPIVTMDTYVGASVVNAKRCA